MGLDMYLSASRYMSGWSHSPDQERARFATMLEAVGFDPALVEERAPSGSIEVHVGYWRKVNAAWLALEANRKAANPFNFPGPFAADVASDPRA